MDCAALDAEIASIDKVLAVVTLQDQLARKTYERVHEAAREAAKTEKLLSTMASTLTRACMNYQYLMDANRGPLSDVHMDADVAVAVEEHAAQAGEGALISPPQPAAPIQDSVVTEQSARGVVTAELQPQQPPVQLQKGLLQPRQAQRDLAQRRPTRRAAVHDAAAHPVSSPDRTNHNIRPALAFSPRQLRGDVRGTSQDLYSVQAIMQRGKAGQESPGASLRRARVSTKPSVREIQQMQARRSPRPKRKPLPNKYTPLPARGIRKAMGPRSAPRVPPQKRTVPDRMPPAGEMAHRSDAIRSRPGGANPISVLGRAGGAGGARIVRSAAGTSHYAGPRDAGGNVAEDGAVDSGWNGKSSSSKGFEKPNGPSVRSGRAVSRHLVAASSTPVHAPAQPALRQNAQPARRFQPGTVRAPTRQPGHAPGQAGGPADGRMHRLSALATARSRAGEPPQRLNPAAPYDAEAPLRTNRPNRGYAFRGNGRTPAPPFAPASAHAAARPAAPTRVPVGEHASPEGPMPLNARGVCVPSRISSSPLRHPADASVDLRQNVRQTDGKRVAIQGMDIQSRRESLRRKSERL